MSLPMRRMPADMGLDVAEAALVLELTGGLWRLPRPRPLDALVGFDRTSLTGRRGASSGVSTDGVRRANASGVGATGTD
jgi:hypothetical protein